MSSQHQTQFALSGDIFSYSVRVYYQDTDTGGVVYNSPYLNFIVRAPYDLPLIH
jgi:acyl-CoA thioester hydrolase